VKQTRQILTQLFTTTEELGASLGKDDAEAVIKKLAERARILAELQEQKDLVALAETDESARLMIGQIRRMDETHTEMVNRSLQRLSDGIGDLGNERKTLRDWQSLASAGKKPIVDFIY